MSDVQFWTGQRVLVTGAAGFIGRRLVKSLTDLGARVVAFDIGSEECPPSEIPHVTNVRGDVTDEATLKETLQTSRVSGVVHLAAQSQVQRANDAPSATFETNIRGTWSVLEAVRQSEVAGIVIASSDKAYGDAQGQPYTESMPLRGRHAYDVSKACADLIAQGYAASYDLPVAISRCANIYGGGDVNWDRLVPGTIRSIIEDTRPVVRSSGTPLRDYLYVEDAVAATILLLREVTSRPELRGEAFNFSANQRVSAIDLVNTILDLMESPLVPDIRNQATNELGDQRVDASKAQSVLAWKPRFDLASGLRETIDWYRTHFEAVP